MAFPWTSNLSFALPSALREVVIRGGGAVFDVVSPLLRTIWGRTREVRSSWGVSAVGAMLDIGDAWEFEKVCLIDDEFNVCNPTDNQSLVTVNPKYGKVLE